MMVELDDEVVAFLRERAASDIALAGRLVKQPPSLDAGKLAVRYIVMWIRVKRALDKGKN